MIPVTISAAATTAKAASMPASIRASMPTSPVPTPIKLNAIATFGVSLISFSFQFIVATQRACLPAVFVHGRGMDIDLLLTLCNFAACSIHPDLVFYLDVPPELGLKRAHFSDHDRFEEETQTFHAQVRTGFLHLANKNPNMIVIDATKPIESVYLETLKHLEIMV